MAEPGAEDGGAACGTDAGVMEVAAAVPPLAGILEGTAPAGAGADRAVAGGAVEARGPAVCFEDEEREGAVIAAGAGPLEVAGGEGAEGEEASIAAPETTAEGRGAETAAAARGRARGRGAERGDAAGA